MSIFDRYENFLPHDKKPRKIKAPFLEYQNLKEEESFEEKPKKTFWFFYLLILIVVGVLVGQLLNLQISQGSFNKFLAKGNRLHERKVPAPRGIIYDTKGVSLVNNNASYCLEIYPLDLPKKESDRQKFYESLSQIIQMPVAEIQDTVKKKGLSQSDSIVLKENIDRDTAMLLETKIVNMSGVAIIKKPIRNYQPVTGMSQIIGYVGKLTDDEKKNNPSLYLDELIGKDGLEKKYQDFLRGQNGAIQIEVDSQGRKQRIVSKTPAAPGNNLYLTINASLEQILADSLQTQLLSSGAKAGAAVAINPQTGAILAMVSLPTYNNNIFSKSMTSEDYQKLIDDPDRPMFNRAIAGTYPSGSTIKPFIAAAGLQDGIITANTSINDPGEIKVGNYTYPDWATHSIVDVEKAIAVSCDVFFYAVGGGWDKIKGLGVQKMHEYLLKFGFNAPLGIDLSGEASGLIPDSDWKEKVKHESWYLGDSYHMAIGQGDVLATPLQMASGLAAIANGGTLLKPYLVSKITDQNGKISSETQKTVIRSNFIDSANIETVRQGMRDCVAEDYGSCRALDVLPVTVAAKTGTAQFGNEDKTHAWMLAFAPYDNPQIAIAVILEGGGEGYAAAGPVVKDTLNWYFSQ